MPTSDRLAFLERSLESLSKIATVASKFGILVGAVCVTWYALRVDHFPQDISIGDGLLFLIAAACFGLVYGAFVASLVALGICASPIVSRLVQLALWGVNKFRERKIAPAHEFATFSWPAVIFALFGVVSIEALGRKDSTAYWNLPLLSIALFFLYSAFLSLGKKTKQIETIQGRLVHVDEKDMIGQLGDPKEMGRGQLVLLLAIMFMPLAVGGVSGQLLDAAMRGARVRVDSAVVYIKEPYATLLPKGAQGSAVSATTPKDYMAFANVKVLFTGFGKTTQIAFAEGSVENQAGRSKRSHHHQG